MNIVGKLNKFVLSGIIAAAIVVGFGSTTAYALIFTEKTIETEQFVSYTGIRSSFSTRYPESWHIYEIPSMPYMRFENIDARSLDSLPAAVRETYFKIEVVVLPANGLSLKEWVNRQNTTSYPLPEVLEQRDITVAGEPALYQVEQFGTLVHPAVFVKKNELIYIINIGNSYEQYKNDTERFISDFEFSS